MITLSESEHARQLAAQVEELSGRFATDGSEGSREAVDYLTQLRELLLKFADNPADRRLRSEVEQRMQRFIALTASAQKGVQ